MKLHGSKTARFVAAVCVVAGSQFAAAPLAVSDDAPGIVRMSDLQPRSNRAAAATIRAQSPEVEQTCFLTKKKSGGGGGCGAQGCCTEPMCAAPMACAVPNCAAPCAEGCNGCGEAGGGGKSQTLFGRMFGAGRGSRSGKGCKCGNPNCQCQNGNGGWGAGANGYASNGDWGSGDGDWDSDDCESGSGSSGGQTLFDALFGCLSPTGACNQGAPPIGKYSITYANNPSYADARDGQAWAAQGYGMPMTVPIAPVVRYTYNYSHGTPASRLTPTSTYNPMTSPQELYHQSW